MTVSRMAQRATTLPAWATFSAAIVAAITVTTAPPAHADYNRLNNGVAQSVYGVKHQAGCTTDLKMNPALNQAAQWQADDVLNDRNLDGDIGSNGSTAQDRAQAAGYRGTVAETVAIAPALSPNGLEILNNWYNRPDYYAIMSNCANTQIGVRTSTNGLDRTVTVAVYGQPG
ncbi:CAP domain-containing protein [Mycobacterium sp.]|uniref:CAP domain-containing protein n=1 Tax=Mycobacterium sp. TaxID=1785 RepID=UPI0011FC88CE|nr:CAP domain-containing protein [Mycobacterium sp.]TAM65614.1 MAG: CAP domain-containing protein [Mycobacterium sp.]